VSTKFNVIDLIGISGARTSACAVYSEELDIINTTSAFAESIEPITEFDTFELAEIPGFILCNPNKEPLYSLGGISDRAYKARFNQLSELSFRADKVVNGIEMPYYDYIVHKRLVYLKNIDYFMITGVEEKGDGLEKYKLVTCQSLEVEFSKRNLALFKHTSLQFYNAVSPSNTLIGKILQYMPDWSVGKINGGFARKYRSFDIANKSIYNFLMNDVEEAYECVFEFDTINKTISAVSVEDATTPTDIYISYDNLIKQISIKESTEELITALSVFGGNGLDINDVNPLGHNTLYDFTYFKTLDSSGSPLWMEESLVTAITNWETLVSGSQAEFADLVTDVKEGYSLLGDMEAELSASQTELEAKEVELAALIRGNLPTLAVKEEIAALETAIALAEANIETWEAVISGSIADMSEISEGLALDNTSNFSEEQQKDLQAFIIEGTYINENIIQTDIMSASSVQEQSEELYLQGQNVLDRISEPRYTFSVDSVNFLQIKEFKPFIRQLELGSQINLEISDGIVVTPVLLGMDIDFDNPTNFKMIFGNRLKLDDAALQFSDLMNDAVNAATSTQVNSLLWSNWDENYKDDVSTFITSALDAAVNNVTSGSNQEIIINKSGLRGRQSDGSGGYLDEQVWLVNNTLAFTDDNWDTAKIAIGEIIGPDGQSIWGIVAEYLIGEFIVGGDLLISNEDSTFSVSGSQAVLTNSNFIINSTSASTTIVMNPWDGIIISDASGSALWIDGHGNLTLGGYVNILGQSLDWDDIANKPQLIIDGVPYYYGEPPAGFEGLFLSGTHMGYIYNGEWTSYLDNGGNFVLGNPDDGYGMYWNQTTGSMLISGSITADGGRITGNLEMSSVNSAITVGYPDTPYRGEDDVVTGEPTFSGCGIWIDRTGLYSIYAGRVQVEISTEDGKFYAGQGSIVLDEEGLSVTQLRDALAFYNEGEIIGDMSSSTRTGEEFISLRKISLEDSDNLVNGNFDSDIRSALPQKWNRIIPDTTYGGVVTEWQTDSFFSTISEPHYIKCRIYASDLSNYMVYEAQSDPIYFEPGTIFSAEGYIGLIDWNSNLLNGWISGSIVASLKFYDNSENLIGEEVIGSQNTNSYVHVYSNNIVSPEGSEFVVYSLSTYGIKHPVATYNPTLEGRADDLSLYYISGSSGGYISSSIELFNDQINYWSAGSHVFSGHISFINDSGFSGEIGSDIILAHSQDYKKYAINSFTGEIFGPYAGYLYVPVHSPEDYALKAFDTYSGPGGDLIATTYNFNFYSNFDGPIVEAKALVIRISAQWTSAGDTNRIEFRSTTSSTNVGYVRAHEASFQQDGIITVPTTGPYGSFVMEVSGATARNVYMYVIGYYI
jgi:hypothetical protein